MTLPYQPPEQKSHGDRGGPEAVGVQIKGKEDAQVRDAQQISNRHPDEAQAAPEQEPLTYVLISAQQEDGAQDRGEEREDVEGNGHQSRSFLKRNARANSRTEGDAFECSMVEMRTISRR